MKEKLILAFVVCATSIPAFAFTPVRVPEPSSVALFAAGGLAIALAAKFKK